MKRIQILVLQLLVVFAATELLSRATAPRTQTPIVETQPGIPATAPGVTITPQPAEVVRFAWFYKPPDRAQMDLVARHADLFILTYKDEAERNEFKAKGIATPFSQYLLFTEIHDPGNCDEDSTGNQVAFKAGDFCMIDQQHPDWFLLDQNGNRIGDEDTYFMDPGNEGFRAFWLERARELQETHGWENIFLDNVEASRAKMVRDDEPLARYPDDASYQQAVEGFLAYIRQNYFEPRGKAMYANIVSVDEYDAWVSYLEYLDGVMIESFATDWDEGYPSRKDWEDQMQRTQSALAQGKTMILVAQGEQDDLDLQNFAFASYLLIADGNTYFRYAHSDSYREYWLYENYEYDLGAPVGERYKYRGGWRRDFEKGYVIVKPQSKEAEIILAP